MKTETQINAFIAASLILFGTLLGGILTYQHLDQRINELEQENPTVHINATQEDAIFPQIFQESHESIVSIEASGEENSQGSGFVFDQEGHIVTNQHVIQGQDQVRIVFTDGTVETAEVVGQDADTDLAVLKTQKEDLEPLELADSNQLQVGERTIAIGNPFGLEGSMTTGVISQTERNIRTREGFSIPNVIQTDAAINPGNSGGPLLNTEGEVVGVNTAIETDTGTFSGVGFAISSNTVQEIAPELIENEEYTHPWIGVQGIDVNVEIAEQRNLENASGWLIMETVENGPAEEAGLQEGNQTVELESGGEILIDGDIIIGIDDREIHEINDMLDYLLTEKDVGESVTIEVIRDGEITEEQVVLQPRPE